MSDKYAELRVALDEADEWGWASPVIETSVIRDLLNDYERALSKRLKGTFKTDGYCLPVDRYWWQNNEEWKRVLDEEFVGIGIAIENTKSPKEALNDLICWHIEASKYLDQMNSHEK